MEKNEREEYDLFEAAVDYVREKVYPSNCTHKPAETNHVLTCRSSSSLNQIIIISSVEIFPPLVSKFTLTELL